MDSASFTSASHTKMAVNMTVSDVESVSTTEEGSIDKTDFNGVGPELVVAIVDPFTSGRKLAAIAGELGYTVVPVLSDPEGHRSKTFMSTSEPSIRYDLTVKHTPGRMFETAEEIQGRGQVLAVIGGAEESIELADKLAEALKLPGNPLPSSLARRDKYTMQETLKAKSVRNIAQVHVKSASEAQSNFRRIGGACVLKPLRSMKSEDVFLCRTSEEVSKAYRSIAGKNNFLNCINEGALLQEYVEGPEYVVDVVSRNGVHKVNSVWSIDRGYANGQFNVMFGATLMSSDTYPAKDLMNYIYEVLDALQVVNGASHSELKMSASGPVLIELGARPCGDPVSGILDKCLGQNQLMQTIDSYLHTSTFDQYPDVPPPLRISGRQSFIMSYQEGVITGIPGLEKLKSLPSVREVFMFKQKGDILDKTIDQKTQAGFCLMWHPSEKVIQRDYETIRKMELQNTFFNTAPPQRASVTE